MLAQQIDIEETIAEQDPVIRKTYSFPKSQELVHDAAHELVNTTMKSGAASNGLNTWLNQEPMRYHVRKGLIHVCNLHQSGDIESRERDEPHLLDIANAVTRFCMAWALKRIRDRMHPVSRETLEAAEE